MTDAEKLSQLVIEINKMYLSGILPSDTPYNEIADTIIKNYTTRDIQNEVLQEQSDMYMKLYIEAQKSIIENIKARQNG